MPRNKSPKSYRDAQARASARAILEKLGVNLSNIEFDSTLESTIRTEVELPDDHPKRFRRTKEEMQQLKDFTEWQIQQRLLKAKNALDSGDVETFAANA